MTTLTPEQKARERIDDLLQAAGWSVQTRDQFNLGASRGVAVAEFPLETGFADYLLFANRSVAGIEADEPRCRETVERNLALTTALAPVTGCGRRGQQASLSQQPHRA